MSGTAMSISDYANENFTSQLEVDAWVQRIFQIANSNRLATGKIVEVKVFPATIDASSSVVSIIRGTANGNEYLDKQGNVLDPTTLPKKRKEIIKIQWTYYSLPAQGKVEYQLIEDIRRGL